MESLQYTMIQWSVIMHSNNSQYPSMWDFVCETSYDFITMKPFQSKQLLSSGRDALENMLGEVQCGRHCLAAEPSPRAQLWSQCQACWIWIAPDWSLAQGYSGSSGFLENGFSMFNGNIEICPILDPFGQSSQCSEVRHFPSPPSNPKYRWSGFEPAWNLCN